MRLLSAILLLLVLYCISPLSASAVRVSVDVSVSPASPSSADSADLASADSQASKQFDVNARGSLVLNAPHSRPMCLSLGRLYSRHPLMPDSFERRLCLLNPTAKRLFPAVTQPQQQKQKVAEYCDYSVPFRLCYVCNFISGRKENAFDGCRDLLVGQSPSAEQFIQQKLNFPGN